MGKYDDIREQSFLGNTQLAELGLVACAFGNVSSADRSRGVFAIKPEGVEAKDLSRLNMVILDFEGKLVEGHLRPSVDARTHALLYQHWEIGGICHTHSTFATAWAQDLKDIPILGTTHARHLQVDVPCAQPLDDQRISGDYEVETGHQIMECLAERGHDYRRVEMILLGSHGPYTWGKNAATAVYNASALEQIAHMAFLTPFAQRIKTALITKHYNRASERGV